MSEIIKLQNGLYEYKAPPPPSREEDILFVKEKKDNQFWRTPIMPDLKRMNVRERVAFIDRERDRWANGVHFMNNGELTYMNGLHYDHLTYMTFEGEKAMYLDYQRQDFLFRELTWKEPKCKGRVYAKARRVGASMDEQTEATYRSMEDLSRHIGLVSIEERKTKKSLFEPIVESLVKRPKFMRPVFYKPNGKKPQQIIKLSSNDIPEDSEFDMGADSLELGGWIMPSPTSVSAFDAYKMHYITADEVWKWIQASPKEFLETQLKCCEVGGAIIGLISMLSTLGDTDDVKKAIADGIYIYMNSDPRSLGADGFTKTGLWKYFISAVCAQHIFKDKFGFINEEQAIEKIMNERSKHEEGSKDWIHEVRRNPLTEEEAMATAEGTTTFDSIRLQDRITIITKTTKAERPYVVGRLEEDPETGRVHFEDDSKGNWKVAIHPKKTTILENEDRSNRWKKDANGLWLMNKSPEGAIGYDPVRYGDKQTVSSNVSKSAIIAKYKFDYFGNKGRFGDSCANRYAGLYHHRDEDPDAPHHEAFKAAKYWGFPVMYERQVDGVLNHFKAIKALNFLLLSKKDGKFGIWTDNQQKVIKKGIDRFQSYIKRPMPGDVDWLKLIPFEELLQQAKELDPANTRTSDIFMANTMLEHAMEQIIFTNLIDEAYEIINGENQNVLAALFR